MDKGLYVGLDAARESMSRLAVITNNLANTDTPGFHADELLIQSKNLNETNDQSRTYTYAQSTYTDFKPGPMYRTGRALDAAIQGDGFFAVQNGTGKEGYTRAGNFELTKDGRLQTRDGGIVIGESGVITLPTNDVENVNIGSDGTVSVKIFGQTDMQIVGKLKLVNPPVDQIKKGTDGLFYMNGNSAAPKANNVTVVSAALEGSNVNPVDSLTKLIDISRSFEFHSRVMKEFQDDASKSNELLTVTA